MSQLLEEKLAVKPPVAIEAPIVMIPHSIEGGGEQGGATAIGSVKEWETRSSKIVSVAGEAVAVLKTTAGLRACQNVCPHAGGSLGEGAVEGEAVTCPLHGWQFDLQTGKCMNEPDNDIKIYPVEVEEGKVYIKK